MASLHLSQEIFKLIYPVGSIYISTVNTNPSTYFGGTWSAVAQGRTLVGVNSSDTDFNTVMKTGGNKTNNHNHITGISFDGNNLFVAESGVMPRSEVRNIKRVVPWSGSASSAAARMDSTDNTDISIVQPYYTVYIFRRTA